MTWAEVRDLVEAGWALDIMPTNRGMNFSGNLEVRLSEKHENGGCETYRALTGRGKTLAEALDALGSKP